MLRTVASTCPRARRTTISLPIATCSAERTTRPEERDTAAEHRGLMEAIAMERDADKAVALIGAHFRATTDVILHAGFAETKAA